MEEESEKKFKNIFDGESEVKVEVPPEENFEMNEIPHVKIGIDNICFDSSEGETLRLKNCSSLPETLTVVAEKLQILSPIAVEASLTHKIDEIIDDDFFKIQALFQHAQLFIFLIESDDEKSNNFLFWPGEGRNQIFVLQLENEEKKISARVRRFLISQLRSGHNGLLPAFKYQRTNSKVDVNIFALGDSRGFNLLSIAAESGEVETLKTLLKLGFDVHVANDGVRAVDLAYNNKHYEVILELLKNHSLYPDNFKVEEVSDELKSFVNLSLTLHDEIIAQNLEKVLEILGNNPNCKFFYDPQNNSALTYAIVRKSFQVYEELMVKNFTFGPFEDVDEILNFINDDRKAQRTLKQIHERHAKPLISKHLMILLSNSSTGHQGESDTEKIAKVAEAYHTLDKIPILSQIFQVVAATRNFKITFDFERESIRLLDPEVGEGYVNGLFTTNGKVLVAAKDLMSDETKSFAYGVIAHELCHFALYKTFENGALPYFEGDSRVEGIYKDVVEDCRTKKDQEEIVQSAFDDYPPKMVGPEVAVRYPHILGQFHDQPEVVEQKSETFASLKQFHEENVRPALDEAIRKFEAKADVKGKYLKSKKKNSTLRKIVLGLLALLVVGGPLVYLLARGPTKVWKELDENEKNLVKNISVDYFGVEVEFGKLFDDSSTAFEDLTPQQIADGLKNDPKSIKEAFNRTLHHKVVLTWQNCTEPLKEKILNSEIEFQGKKVELGKILDSDSKVLLDFSVEQIKNLIEGKSLKIGEKFSSEVKFYIGRRFKEKSRENLKARELKNEKGFFVTDAITEALSEGFFLLVDEPGNGKSTIFKTIAREIKKDFPDFFVAFVNLKEHSEVYRKFEKDFANSIGEKILKLEGLELKIFNELYSKGKVAMVWDAFDEVGKSFHEFLLKFFEEIKNQTKNFQFLSSRPEHEKELSEALSAKVFSFIPFEEEDRERFFEKQLEGLTEENREGIKKKIQKFIEDAESFSFYGEWDRSDRSVNNPMMLQIISDLLKMDQNLDIENRFEVYEKIVERQIESIKDLSPFQLLAKQRLNFYEIHQTFALELLFSEMFPEITSLDIFKQKNSLTAAQVASFGLMKATSDGKLDFIHKTFAQFFAAHYIADKVYNMTEIASESEIELRMKMMFEIFYVYKAVKDPFLLNYLSSFLVIEDWNEENLKSVQKSLSKENFNAFDLIVGPDVFINEIFSRLLMKDYENFLNIINRLFGNVFHLMEQFFQIFVIDTQKLLFFFNDRKIIFEEYKRNQQKGNIYFHIWYHLRTNNFSNSYLINRHTGLNLDKTELKTIRSQEKFSEFYNSISQNLTKVEILKVYEINFDIIFEPFLNAEEFLERWRIFVSALNKEEIEKILYKKERVNAFQGTRRNVLYNILGTRNLTPVILETLLKDIVKYSEKETIREFIKAQNQYGWSLTSSACTHDLEILKVFWKFVQKYLNESEQKFHLLCKFHWNLSFFNVVVCKHKNFFYGVIPKEEIRSTKSLLCNYHRTIESGTGNIPSYLTAPRLPNLD